MSDGRSSIGLASNGDEEDDSNFKSRQSVSDALDGVQVGAKGAAEESKRKSSAQTEEDKALRRDYKKIQKQLVVIEEESRRLRDKNIVLDKEVARLT